MKTIKLFFAGILISFLGTLPFGTLNITAFQLAASQSINEALCYSVAVVFIELLVVRLTLYNKKVFAFDGKLVRLILPFSILLLLYLSASNLIAAYESELPNAISRHPFPIIQSAFILGITLSLLNPMHAPFWLSWNNVLQVKKILTHTRADYAIYITAIGLGSFIALVIFIFAGRMVYSSYNDFKFIITFVMALLYSIFAFYLSYRYFKLIFKLQFQ